MEHDCTVVTVSYNSAERLHENWTHRKTNSNYRWIVVDNASQDDSKAVAQEYGADVIELPRNVGFAAANNVGLSQVTTTYTFFVNPDVCLEPDSLEFLCQTSTKMDALVAPQLLNDDGTRQPNGRGRPYLIDKIAHRGIRFPGARLNEYIPDLIDNSNCEVEWLTGAVIGAETAKFKELAGWDSSYFLYFEDCDLCIRAWRQGIRVVLVGAATWGHGWERATTSWRSASVRYHLRSALRFYTRSPKYILPLRR